MFKKSAIVVLFSMLTSFCYANPVSLEDFQTINIVRVKLWYDGVEPLNKYNQALSRGMQQEVQLPEEILVALDQMDSY